MTDAVTPLPATPLPVTTVATDPSQPQAEASNPQYSAWVTANAGSGKTKVLIDRVARLLLGHGGMAPDPSRILCLTYTKAAAANMQNKLFAQLGGWALMEDDALRTALDGLREKDAPADPSIELDAARKLFAQALETPGGLKIQTIHAFCESLLRRFPLEAGLSPHFTLMDDAEKRDMHAEVLDRVLMRANAGDDPALSVATKTVILVAQESGIHPLVEEIIAKRGAFALPPDALGEAIAQALDIDPAETEDAVLAAFFSETPIEDIRAMAAVFREASASEKKFAAEMTPLLAGNVMRDWVDALALAVLRKDGAPKATSRFPTKAARAIDPDILDKVVRIQDRLATLNNRLKAIAAYDNSRTLVVFAKAILEELASLKEARDGLDFDDLIERAGELLSNREASAWVRYKLDGGVDHILVDEAQDTSPAQWKVISAIAEEFFAGLGARPEHRTLFVVGDEKQSIFSFQGAAPDELDRVRIAFRELVAGTTEPMREPKLLHSFRSSPPILDVVDRVFAGEVAQKGLSADGVAPTHLAFRKTAPGRVEFWPPIGPTPDEDAGNWWEPVDATPALAPEMRLAAGIVDQIATWLDKDDPVLLPAKGRPVRAGDILILVRRRNAFAEALIRLLKARGLPVAGKDRMKLHTQLAVQDMLALARFALLPDDDLTLATVLRSPLVGLSEDDLFELAHARKGRLWNTLYARRNEKPEFGAAVAMLDDMLSEADYLRPYEFFERMLTLHGARGRLLDRLGVQAADPIDELLAQALDFETRGTPSLQAFVARIEESDVDIKREMEQGRDEIRIMTVHGSKGLEANIVFMPDICALPKSASTERIFRIDEHAPIWTPGTGDATAQVAAMRDAGKVLTLEEYRRLLYVGMTRARDWLILCGWHGAAEPRDDSWARLVEDAFGADTVEGPTPLTDGDGTPVIARIFERGGESRPDTEEAGEAILTPLPLDAEMAALPPAETSPPPAIAPSRIGAGEAEPFALPPMPTESEDSELPLSSAERGTILHLLLEKLAPLPQCAREAEGERIAGPEGRATVATALAVLDNPDFAWIFAGQSMAEVPVQGPVSALAGRHILGTIDRLVVENEAVRIVDFKSGRSPGGEVIPSPYLRQLALYRAALGDIFTDRPVTAHLLWIDEERIVDADGAALDDALAGMLADGSLLQKAARNG